MNQYRRLFLLIALLIPVLGMGLTWFLSERESHQGTEWDVPIAGYDPRDLLRGHYVQFRYDWPAVQEEDIPIWSRSPKILCIRGAAPDITSVEVQDEISSDPSVDLACDATARANPWSEEGDNGLTRDRIYVPQEAAGDYDRKLADPKLQAIVRVRINNRGFITPLSLSFQSRPDENSDQDAAE